MIRLHVRKRLVGSEGPFDLDVGFTIPDGCLAVLYGVSGAGKTTLLRMVAGLETPDGGRIEVDGQIWFDASRGICLRPQQRSIGLVFQNYALFPSMTVRRNLEYAAGSRKDPRVDMLLDMVELKELQYRYPDEMSGGQQQRVALARALIRQPKILLLDEPLSALDSAMREKLQSEILRLHRELGLTTILVSHDRSEIRRLADRVVAIERGRIAFEGPPAHAFTSDLSADSDILDGDVVDMYQEDGSVAVVAAAAGDSVRVRIQLDDKRLRELVDKQASQRPNSRSLS